MEPVVVDFQGPGKGAEGRLPLLFAHANGYPPGSYRQLFAALADRFAIRALEHRPLWGGREPPQRLRWDLFAKDMLSALRREYSEPVWVMGHSMGGALAQWYLRYVSDDLPATVLVAPWAAYSVIADGFWPMVKRDPLVVPLSMLSWSAGNWVRNPQRAKEALITEGARLSPQELVAHLNNESIMAVYQHNPPFWSPPPHVQTPMLLLSGQRDAIVTLNGHKRMAKLYNADHQIIADSGHNLMTEASYQQTAQIIHDWLVEQRVN